MAETRCARLSVGRYQGDTTFCCSTRSTPSLTFSATAQVIPVIPFLVEFESKGEIAEVQFHCAKSQ